MCMDEFVKRLYDFMGIYRIFWSQNSHYRYLSIFTDIYRYFTDIFIEIPEQARVLHSWDFFDGKISIFRFFDEKSAILSIFSPIFPLLFLLGADRKPIFW